MAGWRSNEQIENAAEHLKATFRWLKDDEWFASGNPREHIDIIPRDVRIVLSLDPQKLADEYERMHKAARAVGTNGDLEADLAESAAHLANWTGDAADEFRRQVKKIETFCDDQQGRILRGLQCVAAAYALATEVRDSYHKLVQATEAAARIAKEDAEKEDTKLYWAILHNLVDGMLNSSPRNFLNQGAVTGVQISKDITQRVIEGDDADQVMAAYRREADGLCESFGNALDRITQDLSGQVQDAADPETLCKPLLPICHVHSPAFRYENFKNEIRGVGPIGPIVAEEREKYLAEKKVDAPGDSEIGRRLGKGRAV
ncbi:hypothetical protein KIPE111705_35155 [Kibdelosporangium persicum]|uniref:WXG100 family type VII secretion target n=1 Tax=Kibdelosporangium persicum TaxID=2698649 RepID=A0ABX2EYM1_9PSEU|nr:hypothetical protein [Kibdelosporangium persicum]NRN64092.1 hypothetical protein [Kibdelosporangium persicum]